MKLSELPRRHQDTLIRKTLQRAELVRYWWEYRGRLATLLDHVEGARTVKLDPQERREIRDFWSRFGISYINYDWYRLFKALNGRVDPSPRRIGRVSRQEPDGAHLC
jgi:hypothetical protein